MREHDRVAALSATSIQVNDVRGAHRPPIVRQNTQRHPRAVGSGTGEGHGASFGGLGQRNWPWNGTPASPPLPALLRRLGTAPRVRCVSRFEHQHFVVGLESRRPVLSFTPPSYLRSLTGKYCTPICTEGVGRLPRVAVVDKLQNGRRWQQTARLQPRLSSRPLASPRSRFARHRPASDPSRHGKKVICRLGDRSVRLHEAAPPCDVPRCARKNWKASTNVVPSESSCGTTRQERHRVRHDPIGPRLTVRL